MVLLMALMLVRLAREVLGEVHLHLKALMHLTAIEHGMLALTEHAYCWRVCTLASIGRGIVNDLVSCSCASNG